MDSLRLLPASSRGHYPSGIQSGSPGANPIGFEVGPNTSGESLIQLFRTEQNLAGPDAEYSVVSPPSNSALFTQLSSGDDVTITVNNSSPGGLGIPAAGALSYQGVTTQTLNSPGERGGQHDVALRHTGPAAQLPHSGGSRPRLAIVSTSERHCPQTDRARGEATCLGTDGIRSGPTRIGAPCDKDPSISIRK